MQTIVKTNYNFLNQISHYIGKVRDVYNIEDKLLIMIVTDRISAFDKVLPIGIPYKGQILNQIASRFLDATADIVPNWKINTPDPMVTIGLKADPFKIEMVIRGYLTGHAWREYRSGKRLLCGIPLKDGMQENQKFDNPIITPTTKAEVGHDEDISRDELLSKGIVSEKDYLQLESFTYALFEKGTKLAADKGLILVDTKYEFGKINDKIILIDEIHTPDSSRYFYADSYSQAFEQNKPQRQLSKEFVREWLIKEGYQGKDCEEMPEMSGKIATQISNRYIELYEKIIGEPFIKEKSDDILKRVEKNIDYYLQKIYK